MKKTDDGTMIDGIPAEEWIAKNMTAMQARAQKGLRLFRQVERQRMIASEEQWKKFRAEQKARSEK